MYLKSHVTRYMRDIRKIYRSGQATEHSYRAALVELLQAPGNGLEAINEPQRQGANAPDLVLRRNRHVLGRVECKDLHVALDDVAEGPQLKRYRVDFHNLILTNYGEFRWYHHGEPVGDPVIVARLQDGDIQSLSRNYGDLCDLLQAFCLTTPSGITSPEELAIVMAFWTRVIVERILRILKTPGPGSFLHRHRQDLERELLPPLSNEEFADMYAQTLVYALFAARLYHQGRPEEFTLENAFFNMPDTNPFLHREFRAIVTELDPSVQWAVDQLAQHLAQTQIDEVMEGFGSRTERRDPVIHFYEDYLAALNPQQREQRGVYSTPDPVVGYIVRSVDALLRSHFGRHDGLAAPNVRILDPAAGAGSFLLKIIEQIFDTMAGQRGIWPAYVREQLLPRLFGFELLMAPYTLAHMRLERYLETETGFRLKTGERLEIYLTNSLELDESGKTRLEGEFLDHIQEEALAAYKVKEEKPIMVVLGNPPYSGTTANRNDWIDKLLDTYRRIDGTRTKSKGRGWLVDDYVKFIRFGQKQIVDNEEGVLAFITNHGWLDNPTFAGMRQSLLNSFSEIYVLDLHGNSRKKEITPTGNKDQNVFDIQQGVCIALFIKLRDHRGLARVFHNDLWGLRPDKYHALNTNDIESSDWKEIAPQSPFYLFKPFDSETWREYEKGWKVTDIFPIHSTGMVTGRDQFVLDFDYEVLRKRFEKTRDLRIPPDEIRHLVEGYELKDKSHWQLDPGRRAIASEDDWEQFFDRCLYRPFDVRHIYYHDAFVWNRRFDTMRHMRYGTIKTVRQSACTHHNPAAVTRRPMGIVLGRRHPQRVLLHLKQNKGDQSHLPTLSLPAGRNLALMTARGIERDRLWDQVICTQETASHHALSIKEVNVLLPLFLYLDEEILV